MLLHSEEDNHPLEEDSEEETEEDSEEEILKEDSENSLPDLEEEEDLTEGDSEEEIKVKEVVINFLTMEANSQDSEEDLIIINVNFFIFFNLF